MYKLEDLNEKVRTCGKFLSNRITKSRKNPRKLYGKWKKIVCKTRRKFNEKKYGPYQVVKFSVLIQQMDTRKWFVRCLLMDFNAVVSDGDFLQYYPNSTPNNFRIHILSMNLKGQWYVGLCETTLTVDRNCKVCIFLDICGNTLINGQKKLLLRRLNLQSGQNYVEFKYVMYNYSNRD